MSLRRPRRPWLLLLARVQPRRMAPRVTRPSPPGPSIPGSWCRCCLGRAVLSGTARAMAPRRDRPGHPPLAGGRLRRRMARARRRAALATALAGRTSVHGAYGRARDRHGDRGAAARAGPAGRRLPVGAPDGAAPTNRACGARSALRVSAWSGLTRPGARDRPARRRHLGVACAALFDAAVTNVVLHRLAASELPADRPAVLVGLLRRSGQGPPRPCICSSPCCTPASSAR